MAASGNDRPDNNSRNASKPCSEMSEKTIMKKKFLLILLVLFAILLCGTAFVVCRFVTVEDGTPAEALIYQDGHVIKVVRFSDSPPYPQELSDWIAHNNEKLYHATPVVYVPKVRLWFTETKQSFDFLTDAVMSGTHIRSATEKDKQFRDWLQSQTGTKPGPYGMY